MRRARAVIPSLTMALTALGGAGRETEPPAGPIALAWRQIADLPDPLGRKGMYGGVSGGRVVLAGGSNFPVPQRAGGRKTFHRDIFTRPVSADADAGWSRAAASLPRALGEGAAITTGLGLLCVGGHDGREPAADVFLLGWNQTRGDLEFTPLAALPEAVANAAVAELDGWVYVAGGEGRSGSTGTFWRLDLKRARSEPAGARWESLPGWPGRPRFGGILVPVTTARGAALLWGGGIHGPARSVADYLRDAYLYYPRPSEWKPVAMMPRGAVLAAGIAPDLNHVLVLGGSDGHDFERMKELGDRYRIPGDVLIYDGRTDRWMTTGVMPQGVVGAAVADVGERWLLAGGEYSPGLRTPQVFELVIKPPAETPAVHRKGGVP